MALDGLTALANTGSGVDVLAGRNVGGKFVGAVLATDKNGLEIDSANPFPVVGGAAQGNVTDIETASGDGSIVSILKRLRTLLSGTLSISGGVAVSNFPASQVVTGPLTDVQLRATAVPISALALPLPTGAATETTLAALNNKNPVLGPAAPSGSVPVNLSNDLTVGAAASIAALNIDLLTGTASGWFDAQNFHSATIQIIVAASTTGSIIFEQTNDITNAAAGNVWAVDEITSLTPTPNVAAIAFTASTIRMFSGPVVARYIRVRVSTAFSTGTVQAVAVMSQQPYTRSVQTVHQATPANFQSQNYLIANSTNIDIASAALVVTTTSAIFFLAVGVSYEINVPVTAVTGTLPTLDFSIEESDDLGTNWFKVYDFPRIIAAGMYRSPKLPCRGNRVRYVQTVAGTTPSFTRSITRVSFQDTASAISQIIDRTIVTTTLNTVTPSINTQNCRSAQLILSLGTASIAPTLQLEGSDDNGATWYAVGAALAGAASATVQVTVANIQASLLRARTSVVGSTVVLGYVLIKGF
jgi:hypothetical protein